MNGKYLFCLLLCLYCCISESDAQSARERSVELSVNILDNPLRLQLEWTADPTATQYTIYKKELNTDNWGNSIVTLNGEATEFIDTEIVVGEAFEYAVFKEEYELVQETICIPSGTEVEFEIADMYGIGLCCNFGFGYYRVESCGMEMAYGDNFGFGENNIFTICDNGNDCENVTITIAPDLFPNSTSWTLRKTENGDLLGSSGEVGDFISERTKFGLIYAGIEVPVLENRGRILLLIEEEINNTLATELNRLEIDLIKDGWKVLRQTAQKNEAVPQVRNRIQMAYQQFEDLNTLFIIGHVPVPYSGDIYPDTHSENHQGAWSADVYYGELNGHWTDEVANITTAFFERNHNVPGDGKFDQDSIPSTVELAVGRVDFFDMSAFALNEMELTRAYLDKEHSFRNGQIEVEPRGLIDDNFGNAFAAPAASAWRSFSTMFGPENIDELDYFSTMIDESYLWSYGCGSGSHISASGIGNTDDFASNQLKSVFTMLFGSQFGDWDNSNNFLKAPLASGWTLTNCWAGSPAWTFHHMSLGYPIGYSTLKNQNSKDQIYQNGPQLVHMALMGDPSLRMHPFAGSSNLTVLPTTSEVELNWTASTSSDIVGYYVYRATDLQSDFVRISDLINETQFTDLPISSGNYVYMVRAIKKETSASGTYFNPSLGEIATTDFVLSAKPLSNSNNYLNVFPNPSNGLLQLIFERPPGNFELEVLDKTGKLLLQKNGNLSGIEMKLDLLVLPKGLYLIKTKTAQGTFLNRVVLSE